MKFFGKILVTNGNKLCFLSEKLITSLSGDTTADWNLDKFTEKSNDKSIVNNQESGSASPHTSVNSFSNYDPDTSDFMSDFLTNYTDENCDDSDYIPEKKKELVKVRTQIKGTLVISALKVQNQNNQ